MGLFSFMTQDTVRSIVIASKAGVRESVRKPFTVYMKDGNGHVYQEDAYEGYGVFGGKDFYELVAEMNGLGSDRQAGIDLFFGKISVENPKYPSLTEDPLAEVVGKPEDCPDQGFLYDDEVPLAVLFEGPGNNDGQCCDGCQACAVCGEGFDGYGNNAQPLADGKCCDGCNGQVMQARLKEYQKAKAAAAAEEEEGLVAEEPDEASAAEPEGDEVTNTKVEYWGANDGCMEFTSYYIRNGDMHDGDKEKVNSFMASAYEEWGELVNVEDNRKDTSNAKDIDEL